MVRIFYMTHRGKQKKENDKASEVTRIFCDQSIIRNNAIGTTYKVNSNGGNVGLRVSVISKSKQQTWFSNSGISDQEELE